MLRDILRRLLVPEIYRYSPADDSRIIAAAEHEDMMRNSYIIAASMRWVTALRTDQSDADAYRLWDALRRRHYWAIGKTPRGMR
jgi:hypothetical protein